MVNHITVNGVERKVTNTLSCGPGCEPHTYELTNGAYVYRIADTWWLQERGQFKREALVAAATAACVEHGRSEQAESELSVDAKEAA